MSRDAGGDQGARLVPALMAAAGARDRSDSPRVVEVVGPAGAGKTTLLEELSRQSDRIHPIFGFRRAAFAPWLALPALGALPFVLLWRGRDRRQTWGEARRLLRLRTSQRIVRHEAARRPIVGLDQGPIYTLATLPEYGAPNPKGRSFDRWWERLLRDWAGTLDVVVSLDAPDDVLLTRIRERRKAHAVKVRSDAEARDFLRGYRVACARALAAIEVYRKPTLVRYQTGERGPDEVAGDVLAMLEAGRGRCSVLEEAPCH